MVRSGTDRRRRGNVPPPSRAEVTMRLMLTAERLERLASRLEAHVGPPEPRHPHPKKRTT